MTVETLNARITSFKEKIAKKTGTIDKKESLITKKLNNLKKLGVHISREACEDPNLMYKYSDTEVRFLIYDIRYLIEDIERLKREVAEISDSISKYETELEMAIEKNNSRDIQVIIDFLNGWKERVFKYYKEQFEEYIPAQEEMYRINSEYVNWYNSNAYRTSRENPEEYKRIKSEYEAKEKAFRTRWNFIFPYVEGHKDYIFNEAKLQKELDQEADRKYDFIIERTNAIVGQITDASNLSIGQKGDLNGYIIGTRGKAKVETIGAGGYNIQAFHFRTLIHKMN